MRLTPLTETGQSCRAWLHVSFAQVLAVLGPDNVTDEDDEDSVGAAWAFRDEQGREGYVWAFGYRRGQAQACNRFSLDGSLELMGELFPGLVEER